MHAFSLNTELAHLMLALEANCPLIPKRLLSLLCSSCNLGTWHRTEPNGEINDIVVAWL